MKFVLLMLPASLTELSKKSSSIIRLIFPDFREKIIAFGR